MTADASVLHSLDACRAYLQQRLQRPLPGPEAQIMMAPLYRQNRSLARIEDKACREAGVLTLLYPVEDVPHVVLTARREDLNDHAGQISFPGGRREGDETLPETALRETREEIGVPPHLIDLLGPLTPLYIPPSNYCVHPFVGIAKQPPDFQPDEREVDIILDAPLPYLVDPSARAEEPWTLRGQTVQVPFFRLGDHKVWGATAMMLAEFVALFRADALRTDAD